MLGSERWGFRNLSPCLGAHAASTQSLHSQGLESADCPPGPSPRSAAGYTWDRVSTVTGLRAESLREDSTQETILK